MSCTQVHQSDELQQLTQADDPNQSTDSCLADPEQSNLAPNAEPSDRSAITTGDNETATTYSEMRVEPPQLVQINDRTRGPDTSNVPGPIRIPGTYPPEWLPDDETEACMNCDSLFTFIKRRHHCRSCGKIFCGDCCGHKAKLLYLDNKEARVCIHCFSLLHYALTTQNIEPRTISSPTLEQDPRPSTSQVELRLATATVEPSPTRPTIQKTVKVQGVLKNSNSSQSNNANDSVATTSSTSTTDPNTTQADQQSKQVIFADGIRPGTDLSESFPYPLPSSSSGNPSSSSFSLLTRQNRSNHSDEKNSTKKNRSGSGKSHDNGWNKSITVCDELGYLPPIIVSKHSDLALNDGSISSSAPSSLASLIVNQLGLARSGERRSIQASMESRSCPLNGVIKFDEISDLVGVDKVVTFLLLKDFYLKVKLITKQCCIDKLEICQTGDHEDEESIKSMNDRLPEYWSFASEGLARYGQSEIVLVIDKEKDESCIPRDVFKIYLTLHELALRRQTLENLGNLLFQDGLFGNRDTAGLLFVKPIENQCLEGLVKPKRSFLIALILQRWEVPWSKVFPIRLLLRLGHKHEAYPYPVVSFRVREPVYYEVGHTIISILGDFRNFRYSLTHVDGMKVMLNKTTRKVLVQLHQSSYQQFNKVLDSSNNEHVLAWSCCPFQEADGHLVSVQNEDGAYETVEFLKNATNKNISFQDLESGKVLGASFVIFSGALKVNQTGQPAKISIVEDGLLIQLQSCTMSALRNAIHFMHHFDIDCENNQDSLNQVEIDWILDII